MLSKYCKQIADKYKVKVGDVKKLIPNLGNKIKYVLYYKNLQLYLSLGMKLIKIHLCTEKMFSLNTLIISFLMEYNIFAVFNVSFSFIFVLLVGL